MDGLTCKLCVHFIQHYIVYEDRCDAVNCGHCRNLRRRNWRPDSPACGQFQRREGPEALPDRPGVIQYLTKDMLEYILSLKLPPEMDTQPRER